jgi:hypothetical protein
MHPRAPSYTNPPPTGVDARAALRESEAAQGALVLWRRVRGCEGTRVGARPRSRWRQRRRLGTSARPSLTCMVSSTACCASPARPMMDPANRLNFAPRAPCGGSRARRQWQCALVRAVCSVRGRQERGTRGAVRGQLQRAACLSPAPWRRDVCLSSVLP